jgi:hypothetical protein
MEIENIKDLVDVKKHTLGVITNDDMYQSLAKNLIVNLNGKKTREWFTDHAYFCLPLTMANQHGFTILAEYDFSVFWNGGNQPEDLIVNVKAQTGSDLPYAQIISSHFGMGTVTIQNPWVMRSPKGINLLVMNPPNYYIDGIIHMSACIETDNLRRDFTFNLKITRPNHLIEIKKGTPVGYVLPYPRHFIDNYSIKIDEEFTSREVIENERKTSRLFGLERSQVDIYNKRRIGKRYMNGTDIYGNKFEDHQKHLKCPYAKNT